MFPIYSRKNDNPYWILHIRIGLGKKFQLKPTIVTSFDQISPKSMFPVETEKVNTTNDFCIFELVYNNSQNIWD